MVNEIKMVNVESQGGYFLEFFLYIIFVNGIIYFEEVCFFFYLLVNFLVDFYYVVLIV